MLKNVTVKINVITNDKLKKKNKDSRLGEKLMFFSKEHYIKYMFKIHLH